MCHERFVVRMRPAVSRPGMQRSYLARFLAKLYGRVPGRSKLLLAVAALEGGQLTSSTLRDILRVNHRIEVGNFSYGSLLDPHLCDAGVSIGRYVSIGPDTRRLGADHPVSAPLMHPYAYNPALGLVPVASDVPRSELVIGHDAWIGARCIIVSGVRSIGIGAVVGAGSVVTRDVPDFAVMAGVPARLLRFRFPPPVQDVLLAEKPWLLEPDGYVQYSQEWHRDPLQVATTHAGDVGS